MAERPPVHAPVLLEEVVEAFERRLGPDGTGTLVDGTVGAGGHAAALLERLPGVELVGADRDPDSLAVARERLAPFGSRVRLVEARLSELADRLDALGVRGVRGFLVDLGVCSLHFDRPERGFSLQADGPLDMRLDPRTERTAADVVNAWSESDLADLFFQEGGERRSRRVAAAIVADRARAPFLRTLALADCVERALGGPRGKVHPATRVFQALRRAVNSEGEELDAALACAARVLAPGGLFAALTFHSGEDGQVKRALKGAAEFEVLTKRPVEPTRAEVHANPRARSARLRLAARGEGDA